MVQDKYGGSNFFMTDLSVVETASRAYLLNNRQTLNSTETALREDPITRQELDRRGGLRGLLTRSGPQGIERDYLSRFINYQTSLFIDRVTEGDVLRTPSLKTLFEQSRENTPISIGINTELESCCAEIKSKLDDISDQIRIQFRRLRALLRSSITALEEQATNNYNSIIETNLDTRAQLLTELMTRFGNLDLLINNSVTLLRDEATQNYTNLLNGILDSRAQLLDRLINRVNDIELLVKQVNVFIQNLINRRLDDLKTRLSVLSREIITFITDRTKEINENTKNFVESAFERLLVNIDSSLSAQTGALITSAETFSNLQILPVLSTIGSGVVEIIGVTTYISDLVSKILNAVNSLPKTIDNLLKDQFDDFKRFLKDWKADLVKEIASEVSLQVVGESYFKWDSVSTSFPTVTFLFREEGDIQYPRRSQIKLRLPKRKLEITDQDIILLRNNCSKIQNSSYNYGTKRLNCVSTDKRFKTTVFGDNPSQIKELFNALFAVIDEPFEERNLSTTVDRNRVNITKLLTPLNGTGSNGITYAGSFKVNFKKAVLLVNGLKSPIVLAER